VAQHAVVDREAALELGEELRARLELEEVVLGLAPVVDLEAELAHAPVAVALQRGTAGVHLALHLVEHGGAPLLRGFRIEQHDQVVCGSFGQVGLSVRFVRPGGG
jgi:hypothetical protein